LVASGMMPDIGYRTYGPLKYSERFRAVKGTHTRGLGTCVATPPVSQRSSALAEEPHHKMSLVCLGSPLQSFLGKRRTTRDTSWWILPA